MTKIAVTGANGFVGRHLVQELITNGYEVLAIGGSDLPNGAPSDGVTSVAVDLSKPEAVQAIDLRDVSAVIHLAGLAAVGPSFDAPMTYITTNAALEANLFQRAIEQGVTPRFVVISSGSLYDPHDSLPLTEASAVVPNSPYAVSKITQEQLGRYYSNRGFEVIIARPFNHIGPGQGMGFLMSDLASQVVAAERGQATTVMVGNLDAKRDYTDVRDIARAYRLLVEAGKPGETYNICNGTSRSGHEVLDALLDQSTAKPTVKQDPGKMRPSDAPDIFGSYDKLAQATGWEPAFTFASTVHDVIEDWRQR